MRINLNKQKDKKQSFSTSGKNNDNNGKKVSFEHKNVGKDKKEDEVPSEIDEENDLLLKMDDEEELQQQSIANKFNKLQTTKCTAKTKSFWN